MSRVPLVAPVLLLLAACGPDAELVASGKAHSCNIKKVAEEINNNPDKAEELRKTMQEHADNLEAVVETADENKRAALRAAIQVEVEKGC